MGKLMRVCSDIIRILSIDFAGTSHVFPANRNIAPDEFIIIYMVSKSSQMINC